MSADGPYRGEADSETDRVAERLSRYGAQRLSPNSEWLIATRFALVQALAHEAATTRVPVAHRPRRWLLATSLAVLMLGSATMVAAASGPGQPFYQLRLAIESLMIPAAGAGRVDALLSQLESRLEGTRQAILEGDRAVTDLVSAYRQTLASLQASAHSPGGVDRRILDVLERQIDGLEALVNGLPGPAQVNLQQALEEAQQARDDIVDAVTPSAEPPTPPRPSQVPPGPPGPPGRP